MNMRKVHFSKTLCGVDFLLNVLYSKSSNQLDFSTDAQSADFFQVVFIRDGRGVLRVNHQDMKISDYTVFFISQHQKHQWDVEVETLEAYFLVFQEGFLNEFFADQYFTFRLLYFYQAQHSPTISLSQKEFETFQVILQDISKELESPKGDSVHIIRSMLYYMLMLLNRRYSEAKLIELTLANDNIAWRFRQLVERNIYTKQRIEEYAGLMNISRVSLNKAVKEQFNVTASDFIRSRLIFEIKSKLLYTNLSISEIAEELCFSEPNHLSRFFKSREGISPVDFRRCYQNGRE